MNWWLNLLYLGSAIGVCIWGSQVIYSVFFSPLRVIPSPLIFQIFPVYYKLLILWGSVPFVIHQYHLKYGQAIRVGWRRVVFIDRTAADVIYGTYHFEKGVMYEGFNYFGDNVLSTRSKPLHLVRKRLIAPAFTKPVIKDLENFLVASGIKPMSKVLDSLVDPYQAQQEGAVVDIYRYARYLMWDITADISLGSTLGMLQGQNHQLLDWVASLLSYGMLCLLLPFLKSYQPYCMRKTREIQEGLLKEYYGAQQRGVKGTRTLDRFFESKDDKTGAKLSEDEIFSEAHLMLLAGTDTTTNSLCFILYLIIKHPQALKKVYAELEVFNSQDVLSYDQCQSSLPYLSACVKEGLRYLPVVAVPLPREAPLGGRKVLGYFIPEKTEVAVAVYSLHRSPKLWDQPDAFLPERWLPSFGQGQPNNPNYLPFLTGPRGCVGKGLAIMEMTVILANLFNRYDLSLAHPEEDLAVGTLPALQFVKGELIVRITKRVSHSSTPP